VNQESGICHYGVTNQYRVQLILKHETTLFMRCVT